MGGDVRDLTRLRLRQARQLLLPLWRGRAWSPIPLAGLASLAGFLAFWLAGAVHSHAPLLVTAALLLAGAAGFALDDPSGPLVEPSPMPRVARAALRLVGVLAAVGGCWALLVAYAVARQPGLAIARPTLGLAVLLAVDLVASARWGGVAGGPVLIGCVIFAAQVPERWSLLAPGADAGRRLLGVLALAVALLVSCFRDPAARHGRGRVDNI